MPKCERCGKSGMWLVVGRSGLCVDCLEDALNFAESVIEKLKNGGEDRKTVLTALDNMAAAEVAQQAEKDLNDSPFAIWDTSIHSTADQLSRIKRSSSVKIISYDKTTQTGLAAGSGKTPYEVTFQKCTCGDFISRKLPCKHMYKLAAEYGGVNFSKYT